MIQPLFYIGCDPEVFLQDAAGGLVSAIQKIGGTKTCPRPLRALGDGFAVQEDNVAMEFNIPPAPNLDTFKNEMARIKEYLSAEISNMGLQFCKSSAEYFPMKELQHPMAQMFGCDPDWNAWSKKRNAMPIDMDPALRSAGGHVHVGIKLHTLKQKFELIKYMDLFLGVPSVLMDQGELRKILYGQAGACRPKPYGVEYRTLSNFWIFDEKLIEWVWNSTEAAVLAFEKGSIDIDDWRNQIEDSINKNNKDIAMSLVDHFGLVMVDAR